MKHDNLTVCAKHELPACERVLVEVMQSFADHVPDMRADIIATGYRADGVPSAWQLYIERECDTYGATIACFNLLDAATRYTKMAMQIMSQNAEREERAMRIREQQELEEQAKQLAQEEAKRAKRRAKRQRYKAAKRARIKQEAIARFTEHALQIAGIPCNEQTMEAMKKKLWPALFS